MLVPKSKYSAAQSLSRATLVLVVLWLAGRVPAYGQRRLVSVGDRRLSIDCEGDATKQTVVLLAGLGRTAEDWAKVQPAIAAFARVCSYDRAGSGGSDKIAPPQNVAGIVEDLHRLLSAAREKGPYVLVGHSIAGIYCRRFAAAYPTDVAGLLFLDSSHEEQMSRLHEIDPAGPVPSGEMTDLFYPPGQKLDWSTNLPLIVITQGKPGPPIAGLTAEQNAGFARVWRELQEDLSKRSSKGQFRVAENSGHFIQLDEPKLVIKAIRDLVPAR
jgi:pimeloyl-ACP methyl ester carboxylesterase